MLLTKPIWKLQDAKAQLSKLIRDAIANGPQFITKRGEETVVVLSIEEYKKLTSKKPTLMEHLLTAPTVPEFDIEREKQPLRKIEL